MAEVYSKKAKKFNILSTVLWLLGLIFSIIIIIYYAYYISKALETNFVPTKNTN
jgi:tellurite resistance protein TehA-like permease